MPSPQVSIDKSHGRVFALFFLSTLVITFYLILGGVMVRSMLGALIQWRAWGLSQSLYFTLLLSGGGFVVSGLIAWWVLYRQTLSGNSSKQQNFIKFFEQVPPLIWGLVLGPLVAIHSLSVSLFILIVVYTTPRIYLFWLRMILDAEYLQMEAARAMNMKTSLGLWYMLRQQGLGALIGTSFHIFFQSFALVTPVVIIYAFVQRSNFPWFTHEILALMLTETPEAPHWGGWLLSIYILVFLVCPRYKNWSGENYG